MLRPNAPAGARVYQRMMRWVFARAHAERARLGRGLTASGGSGVW
jgi:hypothetical protein